MSMELVNQTQTGAIMERVLLVGDLSRLTPQERVTYYLATCESLGLNPATRPFEYLILDGKMTLYPRRDCTDQLRRRDKISIQIVSRERMEDVYVVTARATNPDGRQDESIGVVCLTNLRGHALSNALMKAETKAKRRVTLSICGLGLVDESEVDSIPGAQRVHVSDEGEIIDVSPPALPVENSENSQPGALILPFGKHRGKALSQVMIEDVGYVKWLSTNTQLDEQVRAAAAALLETSEPALSAAVPDNSPPTLSVEDPEPCEPPAKNQPGALVLPFGRHKGKVLSRVMVEDPGYVRWLAASSQDQHVKAAAAALIETPDNGTPEGATSQNDRSDTYISYEERRRLGQLVADAGISNEMAREWLWARNIPSSQYLTAKTAAEFVAWVESYNNQGDNGEIEETFGDTVDPYFM